MSPLDTPHLVCLRRSIGQLPRSYIAIPVFLILWVGYKIYYKTKVIPPEYVDLITGKREIDDEEDRYLAEQELKGSLTRRQKFWNAL